MYNPNLHHRRSIRLKGYDYSQEGLYFVTICVQDMRCLFGNIVDGEMVLNEYGKIAFNEWAHTPELRPEVQLDTFVIMPNHFHAIVNVVARRGVSHTPSTPNSDICRGVSHTPFVSNVCNRGVCDTPLRSPSNTVGAIVRGYKSAVTKQIREMGFCGTVWQRNYYEHIIRDASDYARIAEYIENNPRNWNIDKFYIQ